MPVQIPGRRGSFDDAVSRLNSGNSNELWELAALVSVLEFFGSSELDLFPALHFERPRLFCDAILKSRASVDRHRQYLPTEFVDILNWSGENLNDPRMESIGRAQSQEEMLFQLMRAVARWANIQIRYQDIANGDVGRTIALYETLPEAGRFRDESTGHLVQEVRDKIHSFLGCSIPDLVLIYALVGLGCRQLFERLKRALRASMTAALAGEVKQTKRLSAILQWMCATRSQISPAISFTARRLSELGGPQVRSEAVDAFLRCWSSETRTLRSLLESPAYAAGSGSWRLSPLERYPIVQLDKSSPTATPSFVVPNYRFYLCSIPRALDYTLQTNLGEEYNQFRGAVYEEYVARMLREKYPRALVIPERPYALRRSETRGPDVVFVEAPGEPLILLEVKARRVSARARSDMDDDSLDANLQDAYAALNRLPSKADDLFAGISEYSELEPYAGRTSRHATLCVCVLPEAPFAINELTYYRCKDEDPCLISIDLQYCIMGIATLERAIASAETGGLALAAVLNEFIQRARHLDLQGPLAEFFGGDPVALGHLYSESFLEGVSRNAASGSPAHAPGQDLQGARSDQL
jgi:hypothetical protein